MEGCHAYIFSDKCQKRRSPAPPAHEYLCTVFKKETGLTIVQYAQRLKIGRARMLLERYPEKDAAEIGRECDNESPSYFGLQFKRITGMMPNQYRKSAAVIRAQ